MANAYTQDIILDADGKPVLDALSLVYKFMGDIQKAVSGIGITSIEDAKKWQQELALNLKMLKQAQSDLRTLQTEKQTRNQGFAEAEKQAKAIATAEVRADKEANNQKTVQAKVHYKQKADDARAEANVEKQLAKEVADFEKAQDRAAITSAKEVAAARREAATAAVTAKARGITNRDDALAAKAASDQRLNQLRAERIAAAENDVAAARGLAERIAIEKTLGRELDATIRVLNRKAEAERKAKEAATSRLTGEDKLPGSLFAGAKLVAPLNVRETANDVGSKTALLGYRFEQEAASLALRTAIANKDATLEQVTAARQRLEVAKANVSAAEKLVAADERDVKVLRDAAEAAANGQQRRAQALSQPYAEAQVNTIGIEAARAEAKTRVAAAEQRVLAATTETTGAAVKDLQIERDRLRAIEQMASAEEVANRRTLAGRAKTALANTALYGVVAGGGYAIFNAIQQGMAGALQLEDEFVKLQAISNSTNSQLSDLKSTIYDIGSTSRYALVDLTKIAQTLAQAGVNSGDMESVLKSVTTLATASGSTPDEAVNLVTSALGSFQLQASEAARVADLMTSALNRTKLTVGQVGQAIQYVGATAFEQNISLEQLLATVGAIAQAGVRSGSTIGTGFRQFLVDLQTPSEKLTKQLASLGLTAADVDVSVRGLPAVLDTLRTAGFGAGQAYAGLETRAAAFYLTAKNNVDVMDQLQLSFATSGAAVVANDRAMNSLTAQWQRFKNVLAESASEGFEAASHHAMELVRWISDLIEKTNEYNNLSRNKKDDPLGERAATDILGSTALGAGAGAGIGAFGGGIGAVPGALIGGGIGLVNGTYNAYVNGNKEVTASSHDLATQLADTSDKVDKQRNLIGEIQKEYQRLIVQKAELSRNDLRSAAETANLTSRFSGLALYLDSTKSRYQSLTDAVLAFTKAQTASLNGDLTANNAQLALTKSQAARTGGTAIAQLLGDPTAKGLLTDADRRALETLKTAAPNSQEGQKAVGILTGDIERILKINGDIGRKVNDVVQSAQTIAVSVGQLRTNRALIAANSAQATPIGAEALTTTNAVNALITQLGSADRKDKGALSSQAIAQLDKLSADLAAAKPRGGTYTAGDTQYLKDQQQEVTSLRQQVTALTAETDAEKKARLQAERDARAAEREAAKRPLVTTADIDAIVNGGSGLNFADRIKNYGERSGANSVSPVGARGTMQVMPTTITDPGYGVQKAANNSIAEIDRVGRDYANAMLAHYKNNETLAAAAYNAGPGNVDKWLKSIGDPRTGAISNSDFASRIPFKETRDYVGRVTAAGRVVDGAGGYSIEGKSEQEAQLQATTIRNALANAGIDATVTIDTKAKKIVVSVRPGTRFTKDRTDLKSDAVAAKQAQTQVTVNQDALTARLRELSKQTSDSAQSDALIAAETALETLNDSIEDAAKKELAAGGFVKGSDEYEEKMRQVRQTIEQNIVDTQQKMADSILKSAQTIIDGAQTAFNKATAGADAAVQMAQSQLSGLDAYSLRNKVPDYVKSLASDRVAQAQENLARVQYDAMPAQIDKDRAAIATAEANAATLTDSTAIDAAKEKIASMNVELAKLVATREALGAQLGAGGILPQNFSQGLDQAIQAFRQANSIGDSFGQTLTNNLGGAIDNINTGLNTMFTSIIDGSQSALSAFGTFAQGVMQWMVQLAAKALATQVLNLLLNLAGSAFGSKLGGSSGTSSWLADGGGSASSSSWLAAADIGAFNGGPIGYARGGAVENGSVAADSVKANLARGEWVVNKKSVDSVGNKFMARLNEHGSKALDSLQSMPSIDMKNHTETNVYVVPPEQQPSMGPNDVRVVLNDELMNGQAKRLVQHIARDQ